MEFWKTPENDPSARRRLSADAMLARDEQVAALRGQGISLRQIGARPGTSLASVQLAVRRIQKRGVPAEEPNLLELYWAQRGLSGPERQAVADRFAVAAAEYWRSERDSPDLEDPGYH
jgi:hypothetical protein